MDKLRSILLIDDNEDDNFIHSRIIRHSGFSGELSIAYDGREALELLLHQKELPEGEGDYFQPDLIFLDINMPRMDGWEFLEEYNKLTPSQKGSLIVVMLTNSDNPDDKEKADSLAYITEFANKPLTSETLQGIVQKFFGV